MTQAFPPRTGVGGEISFPNLMLLAPKVVALSEGHMGEVKTSIIADLMSRTT
jgi:hypothetical protein